jgi:HPr kinase/phosphorylase
MSAPDSIIAQATCVVIGGRALMIEGPPGSGKSSLALALLDRGAGLIGDDGVSLSQCGRLSRGGLSGGDAVIAAPPPNIAGLLEIRGIGIVTWPLAEPAPLSLILTLGEALGAPQHDRLPERLPDQITMRDVLGVPIPVLPFIPGSLAPAVRAEQALIRHGLASIASNRA